MQAFHTTSFTQEVVFATGALAQLAETTARLGWQRMLLCTSRSQHVAGYTEAISVLLGDRLVATYTQVQPHVQETQVSEALTLGLRYNVDAVIGLGGGSPIGMAKAVSRALEQHADRSAPVILSDGYPSCAVIAIPTTYSGSEMTPIYGITRNVDGIMRKVTVSDPQAVPKLIIYDPLLTRQVPKMLTASSGINALAHCFETLYSITRNPLSTATALGSIRAIWPSLPECVKNGADIAARSEMLVGAYLAGYGILNVKIALHHGICHILGGTAGVAHGIANSIMLPHVLRFNLDATAAEIAQAAEPMGIERGKRSDTLIAEIIVQRIFDLVKTMGLPQRLRDVGVSEDDIPHLAQLAFESRTVQNNPKPITDVTQMVTLLQYAW